MYPCLPEDPDVCGFYPSTYPVLGLSGVPPLCMANCSLPGGFDACGICGGIAPIPKVIKYPTGLSALARVGGSVAIWNGTVAASQHIAQFYAPLVNAPVITWNLNHNTNAYSTYVLPTAATGVYDGAVPPGKGYGLVMSANYLVVGSHDSVKRVIQLWVRSSVPPWSWLWTAQDPCPGTYHGFAVAIDENIPKGLYPGNYGIIAAGNPAAFLSGRVFIYTTYSEGILQTLQYGLSNFTDHICFGEAVSSDNGLLAVGAPKFTSGSQTYSGNVFIYRWNPNLTPEPQYEEIVQIPPPVPTANGGFGVSVGVWNDLVVIGDNQHATYLYQIVGSFALPILLEQPVGLNLDSKFGRAVSIWDEFIASGDESYVPPIASMRGTTFVWDRNPLFSTFYRLMYALSDEPSSVSTRYGADVDNRGGCYVVSGMPQATPYGGVTIVNLCRDECYGCDDVLNSCSMDDLCGVCLGDNSTCIDCTGKLHGTAVVDACGVCKGTNTTCVVVPPISIVINCDDTVFINLTHAFQAQWGNAVWTIVSPFPTKGVATITTHTIGSVIVSTLKYDSNPYALGLDSVTLSVTIPKTGATAIVVIPVNIATCIDCFNVTNGPARFDLCGVCNGNNSTCNGCDGVPASGKVFDFCGVCGGNGLSCVVPDATINGTINCTSEVIFVMTHQPASTPVTWSIAVQPNVGSAYVNPISGVVIFNNPGYAGYVSFIVQATSNLNHSVIGLKNISFTILNCSDCSGQQLGTQLYDVCGVCGGNGLSCLGCDGIPFSNVTLDGCGVCGGDGSDCHNFIPGWFVLVIIIVSTVAAVFLLWNCFKVIVGENHFENTPEKPIVPNIPHNVRTEFIQPPIAPPLSNDAHVLGITSPHQQAAFNFPNTVTIPAHNYDPHQKKRD